MGILIILYYNNLKIHDPVAQLSMLIMISPMCNTVVSNHFHSVKNFYFRPPDHVISMD